MKRITEALDSTINIHPQKVAFVDQEREITFELFGLEAKSIATTLLKKNINHKPVAIFIDKKIATLSAMFGILYSNNFYTIIDTMMPKERIESILKTLNPACIILDEAGKAKWEAFGFQEEVILYEKSKTTQIDHDVLNQALASSIDTDPAYILFTSGSTGIPKGTLITHQALISYITWFTTCFDINETTSFGSQTPFYFSMSVSDIYATITSGATFYIIPKMYFSFPVKLLEYLNEKKINTIYWVPSALCIVANLKGLDITELPYLKKVLFAGEVMPTKQLNEWIRHLPNALFANLFGPTETTDICTYYVVNRHLKDDESLPIGNACNNCDVLIVKEDNTLAATGESGELLVRGSFLAAGYYNNEEKTQAAFIQNPVQNAYPEKVYKTGDIVKVNELGEIIYLSRKDFQIKHMGYRIELGEIETVISSFEGLNICACLYDTVSSSIVLFYQSMNRDETSVLEEARKRLLPYMQPNKIKKIDRFPYNQNGKIDRLALKEMI